MDFFEIKNDTIINRIVWDGVSLYNTEEVELVPCQELPNVDIGWQLMDGEWVNPNPPQETEDAS